MPREQVARKVVGLRAILILNNKSQIWIFFQSKDSQNSLLNVRYTGMLVIAYRSNFSEVCVFLVNQTVYFVVHSDVNELAL